MKTKKIIYLKSILVLDFFILDDEKLVLLNCYNSYSRYAENINYSKYLIAKQVISKDNQYMKMKYISLVLRSNNISCMGGVVCTSFRRCGVFVYTLSILPGHLLLVRQ